MPPEGRQQLLCLAISRKQPAKQLSLFDDSLQNKQQCDVVDFVLDSARTKKMLKWSLRFLEHVSIIDVKADKYPELAEKLTKFRLYDEASQLLAEAIESLDKIEKILPLDANRLAGLTSKTMGIAERLGFITDEEKRKKIESAQSLIGYEDPHESIGYRKS